MYKQITHGVYNKYEVEKERKVSVIKFLVFLSVLTLLSSLGN